MRLIILTRQVGACLLVAIPTTSRGTIYGQGFYNGSGVKGYHPYLVILENGSITDKTKRYKMRLTTLFVVFRSLENILPPYVSISRIKSCKDVENSDGEPIEKCKWYREVLSIPMLNLPTWVPIPILASWASWVRTGNGNWMQSKSMDIFSIGKSIPVMKFEGCFNWITWVTKNAPLF